MKKKAISKLFFLGLLGAAIVLNSGCDGNAPSPSASPTTGCVVKQVNETRGSSTRIYKYINDPQHDPESMLATNDKKYIFSDMNTNPKMEVIDLNTNTIKEVHLMTLNSRNKPIEILIYLNISGAMVESKKRVFTYVPRTVAGITTYPLDKIESFTKNSAGTYVSNGYQIYTYNASFTRFDEIHYGSSGSTFLTAKFTGWDGKKNPSYGRIDQLFLNLSYFSDFDYWMAQNPTSFSFTSGGSVANGTVTYDSYNQHNYPIDYIINDGTNTIQNEIDYECY